MAQQQQPNRPQQPATPPAKTPGSPPDNLALREQQPVAVEDLQYAPTSDKVEGIRQVVTAAGVIQKGQAQRDVSDKVPPRPTVDRDWLAQAREYLTANGWEPLGPGELANVWRDPLGAGDQRAVRTHVGDLPKGPTEAHGTNPLHQMVCPPARWDMLTEQAVVTQRMRDAALVKNADASPLERIDRMAAQIGQLENRLASLAADMESLLRRSVPDKGEDALRREITHLRRAVQGAVARLRQTEAATVAA